jgi:DNA-binding beta-propeller fold protein YncE
VRWGVSFVAAALGLGLLGGAADAGQRAAAPIGTKVIVGANPSAVTIGRSGRVAYVTTAQINSRRGSLVFVSTATRRVVRKVRVGQNPEAVALSRSGAQAFVANYSSDTISVVKTRTGAARAVKAGKQPASLLDAVVGGRELLFVANGGPVQPPSGTVQVIAVKTMRTVKTIRLSYNPSSLAATRNGRTVFVGNANAPRFSVVNTRTMKVTRSVRLTNAAPVNALAVSRDGTRLYVATLSGTAVISVPALRQVTFIPADDPGDPLGVAVGPGGLALAVNGQGEASQPAPGSLTVIKGTTRVKSVGPLGFFAGDVAITPNGRATWVTNFGIRNGGYVLTFPTPQA